MKQNTEKDQHFLIDEKVLEKEIEVANIKKLDKVIEIGCGGGFLTKQLLNKSSKVLGFELDERYKTILEKLSSSNLEMRFENALNSSWRGFNKIVSNIPYSISEPLILKAIKEKIDELVLIVGENFKEILKDKSTKIGLISDVYYDFEAIEKVGREKFDPIPRVDSWLIKLKKKKVDSKGKKFQKFLEYEGKIKNSLINILTSEGKTKKEARLAVKNLGLNEFLLNKSVKRISASGILLIRGALDKAE